MREPLTLRGGSRIFSFDSEANMKIEFHLNGSAQLCLTPETDLEKAILQDLANRAKLGKRITFAPVDGDGRLAQLKVNVEA